MAPSESPILSRVLRQDAVALGRFHGTRQEFHRGQFIFYQGHTPIGIYVHESGRVAFLRGNKKVSECLQPCVLGLQAVLKEARHPYSARAEDDVCVTFVSRSALLLSVRHDFQNS